MFSEFKNRNVLTTYFFYLCLTFIVSFISYFYGFKFELQSYLLEPNGYISFAVNFIITSLIFGVLINSPKKKYYPDDFSHIHLLKQVYRLKIGEVFLGIAIAMFMAPIIIMMIMFYNWVQTLIGFVIFFFIIVFFYNYGFYLVLFFICLFFNMFLYSTLFVQEGLTDEEDIYTKKDLSK